MNVNSSIRVSDLIQSIDRSNINVETKKAMVELLSRIDRMMQELIFQLKKEPTIFIVDPIGSDGLTVEDVEGAKPGDLAVYQDVNGATEIEILT